MHVHLRAAVCTVLTDSQLWLPYTEKALTICDAGPPTEDRIIGLSLTLHRNGGFPAMYSEWLP
jgi:hypothetical protein